MHGVKALLIVFVLAILGTAGVFLFVPGLRPGYRAGLGQQGQGIHPRQKSQ